MNCSQSPKLCHQRPGSGASVQVRAPSWTFLPPSLFNDLFIWLRMDGLPGETFVTDYSLNQYHGVMVKNTQTLDYDSFGLKWGPSQGAGTVHSSIDFPVSLGMPSGVPSPNLITSFLVVNHYGGGSLNFQQLSRFCDAASLHDVNYRPFSNFINRANGTIPNNSLLVTNARGSTSNNMVASELSSVPYGGVSFLAPNWRLITYRRQGAGTSNHLLRVNRKEQVPFVAAGDFVNASPNPLAATNWTIASPTTQQMMGYCSWWMVFNRNLTSDEYLWVESYIYTEMAKRGIFLEDLP